MKTSNVITFCTGLLFVGSVFSQQPVPQQTLPPPSGSTSEALPAPTVEGIMTQAVKNIARRYNLNDEQTAYTDKMMKERVTQFLKEHEKDVWPIIRELLASGLQAPTDPETRKRIGEAARPLAKLASKAIFDANKEWSGILTDEQRALHQYDLEEMTHQFDSIDKNFLDWSEGRATDQGVFPPPPREAGAPARPKKPGPGLSFPKAEKKLPEPAQASVETGVFEAIVEQFIKDYELDEGQRDSARSILTEFKTKAAAYLETKKEEIVKADKEKSEALASANRDAIAKASKVRDDLTAPVHNLLEQMDVRLKGLLTTAQVEKHAQMVSAKGSKKPNRPGTPVKQPPANPAATPAPATPTQPAPTNPPTAAAPSQPAPATPAPAGDPKPAPSNEPKEEKPKDSE